VYWVRIGRGLNKVIFRGIFQYIVKLREFFSMRWTHVLCQRFIEWSPHESRSMVNTHSYLISSVDKIEYDPKTLIVHLPSRWFKLMARPSHLNPRFHIKSHDFQLFNCQMLDVEPWTLYVGFWHGMAHQISPLVFISFSFTTIPYWSFVYPYPKSKISKFFLMLLLEKIIYSNWNLFQNSIYLNFPFFVYRSI